MVNSLPEQKLHHDSRHKILIIIDKLLQRHEDGNIYLYIVTYIHTTSPNDSRAQKKWMEKQKWGKRIDNKRSLNMCLLKLI